MKESKLQKSAEQEPYNIGSYLYPIKIFTTESTGGNL